MKLIIKIAAGIIALVVLVMIGLNLLISADAVRDRVAARVKEQTGRDLKVSGGTSLLFLPNPRIVITDASLTDPSGRPGAADISIGRLELDLNFAELLSRQLDAEQMRLVQPVLTVHLGNDTPGRQGNLDPQRPERHASLPPRFIAADLGGGELHDLRLNDVRIEDGTIRILYDAQGTERRVEHLNAQFSLPHVTDPLTAKGKLEWKGTPVDFDLTLATPADLRNGRQAKLDLGLSTDAVSGKFAGTVATRPDFTAEGELSAKSQSVPSLVSWLRAKSNALQSLGQGELTSHVSWKTGEVSFSQARFSLAHGTGEGQAVLTLKAPRPYLRAALAIDQLDLDPLLPAKPERPEPGADKEASGQPSAPAEPAPQTGSRWFTKPADSGVPAHAPQPNPAATPPSREQRSSADAQVPPSAPVAVFAPAAFDADVNLNVRETKLAGLTIGASAVSVGMRDGVLNATLGSMQLYGGQGQGKLSIDGSKPVPTFATELTLNGVQAAPLLADAANFKLLSGNANLSISLSGAGSSMSEVRTSVAGNANLSLSGGAIEGIDLTALIKSVGSGEMPTMEQSQGAKTEFSDLSGTFTIASGLARTTDLEMTSPLLKVTAKGTVDTIIGDINLLAEPQIVAGPQGKGGANDLAGLSIPLRIEGPLAHPSVRPELKGLFANPEQASKAVNQIGAVLQKKFKGKPVGEAIGKLLGGVKIGRESAGPGDSDPPPAPAGKKKPNAAAAPEAGASQQDQTEQDQNSSGDSEPDDETDPDLKEILR